MTPEQIDRLRELLDKATPGPWRLGSWQDNVFGTGPRDEWLPVCRVKRDDAPIEESVDHIDAALIAESRNDIPDLLAALAIKDAAIARLTETLRNIRELNMTGADENGHCWAHSDLIEQEIVAALMKDTP